MEAAAAIAFVGRIAPKLLEFLDANRKLRQNLEYDITYIRNEFALISATIQQDDGMMDTDEDSLAKAMRRKAAQNLDNQGMMSSTKSFLSFSATTIASKLNNVGVSLGTNEKDISVSTNALRHLEYDRLKVTPRVSSKSFISQLDEEELHATSDGQLLSHLVGAVSDVGLDEPGLSSLIELTASGRKSKTARSKKDSKSHKRAKCSKSPIVSS